MRCCSTRVLLEALREQSGMHDLLSYAPVADALIGLHPMVWFPHDRCGYRTISHEQDVTRLGQRHCGKHPRLSEIPT